MKTGKKGGQTYISSNQRPRRRSSRLLILFVSAALSPLSVAFFGLFFLYYYCFFFLFFLLSLTLSACCGEAPNQQRSDWEVDVGRPLLPPRGLSGSVTLGFSHCQEAGRMKTLGY